MEDDAARVRVYPYTLTRLQHLINARTCLEVQRLQVEIPLFGVFTRLNVWTDEGQPCDYSASCSILPAFRMWIPIDTSYPKGALSKSP